MTIILLTSCFLTSAFGATNGDWNYAENGPEKWPSMNGYRTCGGDRQSPIDIRASNVDNEYPVCPDRRRTFNWQYNLNHQYWKVENSGYSLKLTPVADSSGSAVTHRKEVSWFTNKLFDQLKGTDQTQYCLDQLHFHVGRTNCEGSEHLLEGKGFPLEIHWVHSLCEYDDINAAIASGKENALSVIGMFFHLSDISNMNSDNPSLATFINEENINQLIAPNSYFISDSIAVKDLLPCEDGFCGMVREKYWFYDGALTTPGCNEIVRWQVFEDTSYVSRLQLQLLRRMEQPGGTQYGVTGTFRSPAFTKNNKPLNYVYEDCTL